MKTKISQIEFIYFNHKFINYIIINQHKYSTFYKIKKHALKTKNP